MVETLILIIVLAFTVGILWLAKRHGIVMRTGLKRFQRSFTKQSYAVKTIKNVEIHNGCLI